MMYNLLKFFIAILLLFAMGCSDKKKQFTHKQLQNVEVREIQDSLTVIDSLNLSELGIYESGKLEINQTHIFVTGKNKITAIDKSNFQNYYSISLPEGKGPQEILQLKSFDVGSSLLMVLDERQNKILKFKPNGQFLEEKTFKEILPHQVRLADGNSYVLFTPMIGMEYLFSVVKKGVVRRFENIPSEHNPMVYEGAIETNKNNIYYAGYSEPVLKKYSSEGSLLYSIAPINNYNTEANYIKSEGGTMMGYTPGAQFSVEDHEIFRDYWITIVYNSNNNLSNKLDIYNEENGNYIGSIEGLKPNTSQIEIDDKTIYTMVLNEEGEYILMLYENNIE